MTNLILILILMFLNFQYYVLSEESKLLKETIFELKEQNQNLITEVNRLSETTEKTKQFSYNSYTVNSILVISGLFLITSIVFYYYGSYFESSNLFSNLKASKIVNESSQEYTTNLMNQLHSQNASQISWMDKKFDSIINIIQKANVFNNQWFIENVMPLLENPINNCYNPYDNIESKSYIENTKNMAWSKINNQNDFIKGINNETCEKITNIGFANNFQEINKYNNNFCGNSVCMSLENFEKEKTLNLGNFDNLMNIMEQTLETAKWT